jgi:hypothetical protein
MLEKISSNCIAMTVSVVWPRRGVHLLSQHPHRRRSGPRRHLRVASQPARAHPRPRRYGAALHGTRRRRAVSAPSTPNSTRVRPGAYRRTCCCACCPTGTRNRTSRRSCSTSSEPSNYLASHTASPRRSQYIHPARTPKPQVTAPPSHQTRGTSVYSAHRAVYSASYPRTGRARRPEAWSRPGRRVP